MEVVYSPEPLVAMEFSREGAAPTVVAVVPLAAGEDCHRALYDPNAVCADAAASNTSMFYSGRHDHGSLPRLHDSGHYADLISALQDSKSRLESGIKSLEESIGKTSGSGADVVDEDAVKPALKKPRAE